MHRFIVVLLIILIAGFGCSKCSKEEEMKREDTQMSAQKEQEAQPAEDAGLSVNTSDVAENPSMMHPNIRFVQTPDGKMVPEAAFKLKLPKMLNSQFLKNAVKEQKEEESKGKVETEKEESR